jgi:ribosomal protein S18 acetylase RimI-like enzyme
MVLLRTLFDWWSGSGSQSPETTLQLQLVEPNTGSSLCDNNLAGHDNYIIEDDTGHSTNDANYSCRLVFRTIEPSDRIAVQRLHEAWFPVNYGDDFYDDLVAGRPTSFGEPFYSCVVATTNSQTESDEEACTLRHNTSDIVACVIGTFLNTSRLPDTLQTLLVSDKRRYSRLFYIMTLGSTQRRRGWGTTLVQLCLDRAMRDAHCGAVYLHVLTKNYAAIRLYEKMGFTRVHEVENYYWIDGQYYNCFLYAKFLSGNKGPNRRGVFSRVTETFAAVWQLLIRAPLERLMDYSESSAGRLLPRY